MRKEYGFAGDEKEARHSRKIYKQNNPIEAYSEVEKNNFDVFILDYVNVSCCISDGKTDRESRLYKLK